MVGARVTLAPGDQSAAQEVISGENGQFSYTNIVPGNFQIRISATGFATQTISGTLRSGEVYIAPAVTLHLAALATEIEVRPQAEIAQAQIKAQEKQRILGVVPNFYVSYVPDAVPLNARQKWELAWRSLVDPVTIGLTAVAAGVEHAQDDYSGYGQGAQGYMKRLGAGYADEVTATVIGDALLPAVLKQDPRYFYKGTGSTRSRIVYALATSVICKGDNQRWQPNYSAILGGLASGAISNLYYPPQDRGASLVFENFAIGTGTTAVLNLFQEFVVRRLTPHLPQKHQTQTNQSKH